MGGDEVLFGIITTLAGILGVIGFFIHNMTLVIIGGVSGLVVNIIGLLSGQQKSILTATIAVVAGIIYSSAAGLSFWMGGLIGLSFSTAIAGIVGWIMMYRYKD